MGNEKFDHLLKLGKRVCDDSRKVQPGDVFVSISGPGTDGLGYIKEAVERGASAIVASHQVCSQSDVDGIIGVEDPREALWLLAQNYYDTKNTPIKVVGITGTNGKTTCAWLMDHLYASLGFKTALLGTIEYRWPGHKQPANLTTPGTLQLHEMLADMQKHGVERLIMEISSHSLAQQRVGGIDFSGAIFTNLTQDHLDFHREMENYFREKAKLFFHYPLANKACSINHDDRYGRRLLELLPHALSFGLHDAPHRETHLQGIIESLTPQGMKLKMKLNKQKWTLRTTLIGAYNVLNLLAVQGLALEMGVSQEELKNLESFTGVPGRLERIVNKKGLHIFVDYAHTPDALVNALKALRGAGFKRLVTVFGCGGNRDRDKRPLMGKAVADNSDVAVLTSDNPRMEAPEAIMRDVKPGLAKAARVLYEVDRHTATARAIQLLGQEDALLIAGKGHEDYQIIGTEKRHYSDQEVVRELCD